jgi:hypothetical protein
VEPPRHARSRGAFGAPESSGHLRERKLLGYPKLDGLGHVEGMLFERRRQRRADGAQIRQLLDAGERRVVQSGALEVQSSARAIVDPLSPQRVVELVACDANQPGERRRAGVAVAPPSGEGRSKRFRGEGGSLLRVPRPAREVREQSLGVPVVEDPERLGISSRAREQFGVSSLHHL